MACVKNCKNGEDCDGSCIPTSVEERAKEYADRRCRISLEKDESQKEAKRDKSQSWANYYEGYVAGAYGS